VQMPVIQDRPTEAALGLLLDEIALFPLGLLKVKSQASFSGNHSMENAGGRAQRWMRGS
jgi:hypothetical protein